MAKQDLSVPKLMQRLATEADAYELLEELRWNGRPVCPHCGSIASHYFLTPKNGTTRKTRTGSLSQRRVWKCKDCRKQFSVLTGTIFHGSKISVRTWVLVVLEMCASKNGVSAREIERKYDLTPKTAWFMLHRIREAMRRDPLAGLLSGTVVADETWIGGKPRNRHGGTRHLKGRNRSPVEDKTPVLALVNSETGQVRSTVVADVTGATLRKAMADQVDAANSDLHTDTSKSYTSLGPEFRSHETVNHFRSEYVRDNVSTNRAEGYFSQLKRSIDGTHHQVSKEHLERYLAQFDFLYSHCHATDTDRMRLVLDNAGGRRLTYRPLTSES